MAVVVPGCGCTEPRCSARQSWSPSPDISVDRWYGARISCARKEAFVKRQNDDGDLDRRHFLKCMAWVGTGAAWTLSNGVLRGAPLGETARVPGMVHGSGALRFVQISDSHIGFNKP